MSKPDDLRLIEDYLPIEAISAEASREKSVRKGHISTLHLWWARRPLVACRAAVYGALVPADRWVRDLDVKNPPADSAKAEAFKSGARRGLNRKAAKEFVTKLCRYPKTDPKKPADIKLKRETEAAIVEAQRHILEAHAERLTAELAEAPTTGKPPAWVEEFKFQGNKVTYDDIIAGRAPRPRVLDMFAGGGAIPLEALRLGCEAYALDLNPVAHIIQLCTLVYPQKYGKPDPTGRGMTGRKNDKGETTWGGLASEVRYWGNWVLDRVRKEIGDLYPPIPDPEVWATPPEIAFDRQTGQWLVTKPGKPKRGVKLESLEPVPNQAASLLPGGDGDDEDEEEETSGNAAAIPLPTGFLQPVAYLWTRTVRCKNPGCGATVPLAKQTWLCQKSNRVVALHMKTPRGTKVVHFETRAADSGDELDFDPSSFSSGGNATCPFCGAVAESEYVKVEGCGNRMGRQPMAIVCIRPGKKGKVYLGADQRFDRTTEKLAETAVAKLVWETGLTIPDEPIVTDAKNSNWIRLYGIVTFGQMFMPRQLACLLCFASKVRDLQKALVSHGIERTRVQAVRTLLGAFVDRIADYNSTGCIWESGGEFIKSTFGQKGLPLTWDFAELAPFGGASGSPAGAIAWITAVIKAESFESDGGRVIRGSAMSMPYADASMDAVVTDPPYYDNVPYADIADYFYVWLKRSIGDLYPEHFAAVSTPKKGEAVADATRHGNDKEKAERAYEQMMQNSFAEAARSLKPAGEMAVVYAHKTTLGWATLVDALRRAGFIVSEAWPLDTERPGRVRAIESAALASSIFLVARKRAQDAGVGNYEDDVQPELQQIVRERVETLWDMGIAGADLVVACVGAGLRAFTRYEKVEYANGEEVPAEKFLAEVEGAVLDAMMGKLFGQPGGKVSAIDPASRFYVLWRFVYKASEIDAGEAIVFTYAQHVELDGPLGLSAGKDALVEKKKAKYRARDFTERGDNDRLGLPDGAGKPAPLIDVLHRVLWLMEHSPRKLREFLMDATPDRERLRVLAQALAGAALSGKTEADAEKLVGTTPAEKAALGKLLANWRSVIENVVETREERAERERGQHRLFE